MTGPLSGYRVLDLTTMVSAPVATMMLGDQGADVIKIEAPGGELMRKVGVNHKGMSSSFLSCNRSKRSLGIDLKTEAGLEAVKRLAATADVFVQNFRPGAIDRMGLGESVIRDIKPDIIYVSINGFGTKGPYANQRVYDPVIQALCGLAEIQADRESGMPKMVRTIIPDKTTAVTSAQAITAALLVRERTGKGQNIEIAMLDTMVAYLWPETMSSLNFVGNEADPSRSQMGLDLVFATQDGHITAGAVTDREWVGMCKAFGRPELIDDERFKTPALRSKHIVERRSIMSQEIAKWPSAEILKRLSSEEVPCAPIVKRTELLENEQVLTNEIIEVHDHPVLGQVRQPRPAALFSETPIRVEALAPFLGENNAEILSEIGYSDEEISSLQAEGVAHGT